MKKHKFTDKQSCATCIHKKVCAIYEFAKKHNEQSIVKFVPYTMADICNHYHKDLNMFPVGEKENVKQK